MIKKIVCWSVTRGGLETLDNGQAFPRKFISKQTVPIAPAKKPHIVGLMNLFRSSQSPKRPTA